jgi:hypothetical protein
MYANAGLTSTTAPALLVARSRARVGPAATGTARTERRAASARFRPSASARLPVRDAPAADDEQEGGSRLLLRDGCSSLGADSRPAAHY